MAATVIPAVPLYTGDVPLIGQGEPTFSTNAQNSLIFQAGLPVDLNASITKMNVLSAELDNALTRTVISNDSELYALSPNSPIQFNGGTLRPNTLIGTLINNEGVAGKVGAIVHEPATGGVWFYIPNANAPALGGQLKDLTGSAALPVDLNSYTENVGTDISSIDASSVTVVKEALSTGKTIAFTNLPALGGARSYSCLIHVSDPIGSGSVGFPPMTKFSGKTQPTLTANGVDRFFMQTFGEMVADPDQGGAMVVQWYCQYDQDFGVPA